MNRQIQILKKDLLKANEKLAAQTATPPQAASMALQATPMVAAVQPPPAAFTPSTKATSHGSSTSAHNASYYAPIGAGIPASI